jgi:preprotein translocase subunit SecB
MNERQRADKVGALADLRSISLRTLDARLPELHGSDGAIDLDVSWETTLQPSQSTLLTYMFHLSVGTATGRDLHVDCEFELEYSLPEDADVEDEDLEAFGDISATFSAFPYARELVQSLASRASLPPLVLGTLRAPIDPPSADDQVD